LILHCLYRRGTDVVYLLLYLDDIVLTASSSVYSGAPFRLCSRSFLSRIWANFTTSLACMFSGVLLVFSFLSQYILEILARADMEDCKPCSTLVDTNPKVSAAAGSPVENATDFRRLVGALQYLTFTRPDISYAVQQVCLHMHDPRSPHLAALKRILRYLQGTLDLGLLLRPTSQTDPVAYSDVDWAGCPDTHKSTSGCAVFLGSDLIS